MSKTTTLIYRGHTFDYACPYPQELLPQSFTNLEDYPTQKVKLIYRGLTFERTMPMYPIHHKPQTINWRFQITSKSSSDIA
jgi:hypothetical protein